MRCSSSCEFLHKTADLYYVWLANQMSVLCTVFVSVLKVFFVFELVLRMVHMALLEDLACMLSACIRRVSCLLRKSVL